VIYIDRENVFVWDYETGIRTTIMTFEKKNRCFAWDMTRDFKYMYTVSRDHQLEKWDLTLKPPRVVLSKSTNDIFGWRFRIRIVNFIEEILW
jgi:WD40 repeat protein